MVAGMMTGCGKCRQCTDTQESVSNSSGDDQVVIDVFQNKNEISDALCCKTLMKKTKYKRLI